MTQVAETTDVIVERGLWTPTRDGVRLVTDVYRPATPEPVPALLLRTRPIRDNPFGPEAVIDLTRLRADWFRRQLRDEQSHDEQSHGEPVADLPPVRIFVMGTNQWRDEQEWPLARTEYTRWYLHDDGTLLPTPPSGDDETDAFTYDPAGPVPTVGGRLLGAGGEEPGLLDQRAVGDRADVLTYLSPALTEDLELTGPVVMDLWAATDAPDTDFTALLVDVHPDGRVLNLCEGAVRARHSGVVLPLAPNAVYHHSIDLAATSIVLPAGHRVGVRISSSSFPEWEPNPNTGHPLGADTDADLRIAHQAVHRNRQHPTAIVLPVIPQRHVQ